MQAEVYNDQDAQHVKIRTIAQEIGVAVPKIVRGDVLEGRGDLRNQILIIPDRTTFDEHSGVDFALRRELALLKGQQDRKLRKLNLCMQAVMLGACLSRCRRVATAVCLLKPFILSAFLKHSERQAVITACQTASDESKQNMAKILFFRRMMQRPRSPVDLLTVKLNGDSWWFLDDLPTSSSLEETIIEAISSAAMRESVERRLGEFELFLPLLIGDELT